MTVEQAIKVLAGIFVLLGFAFGFDSSPLFIHKYWSFLTAFVGFGLLVSGLTGFCPLVPVLKAMGFKSSSESCGARCG